MEGVDYDETFSPVACMESIRILLTIACHLKFKLYQMDVKTAFLNDRLTQYLVSHGFTRGKANQTLFIKKEDGKLIITQVYIDDIIFGSTKDELVHGFSKLMQAEFEMSMIRELTHFLGLQIRQLDSGIFLS